MHNFTTLADCRSVRMLTLGPASQVRLGYCTVTLHGIYDPIFRRSPSLMPAPLLGIVADVFA